MIALTRLTTNDVMETYRRLDRGNSIGDALQLTKSCTKRSIDSQAGLISFGEDPG